MDSIKSALESIGRMWAALKATQKVILSASAAAMVLLLVWGSGSTVPAMVRVAGPELDAAKRQTILAKFQERNQKHEVRGAEIFVPKEDADRVVLELAGEGTMNDSGVWKFLEQSDIFATRWDKEKRYQVALQSRLESMIRGIESVKNASVVINPGSTSSQLGFVGAKASASVQVELKEGASLSRKNVQAIAGLVARAVTGVEQDQVHVMDTKGIGYRVPKSEPVAEDFSDLELMREAKIQRDLKDTPAFAGASVIVRVQANTKTIKVNKVEHSKPIAIETVETTAVRKGSSAALPQVKKGDGDPSVEPPAREEDKTTGITEKRVVDRKDTTEDSPAGEVLRITVGVLIPIEVGPDNKELIEAEKDLSKLREHVLRAAGPQARPEDVSVQFIPTKRPQAIVVPPPPDRAFEWFTVHGSKIALFGLALAGLFVMLRIAQVAMARDTVEELQSLTTALTETGEAAAASGLPAESELGRLKQSVQDMVGRNPQSVAASLKSFMSGK